MERRDLLAPSSRVTKVEWKTPGSRTILEEQLILKGKTGRRRQSRGMRKSSPVLRPPHNSLVKPHHLSLLSFPSRDTIFLHDQHGPTR